MNEMAALRLPPHSVDSEESVIGGVLMSNNSWDLVSSILRAEDFYSSGCRHLFIAIGQLIEAGKPADALTVAEVLNNSGKLQDVGGIEYIQSVVDGTPSAKNIRVYAEFVREKSLRRAIMSAGEQLIDSAMVDGDPLEALDAAQAKLLAMHGGEGDVQTAAELIASFDDVMRRRKAGEIVGIKTGFADIDRELSGLHGGNLIVVAGRPSMGKSSLAFQIAENVAMRGTHALCFSMEMSKQEFMDRTMSRIGDIPLPDVISGAAHESANMSKAYEKAASMTLLIDESGGLTVQQVRARSRAAKRKHGIGIIVIDYLQLMAANGDTRNSQIESITRGLKALAKELHIPIILLSQLNRKCEERADKRPMLSDLRESGAIEQDADVVLFVYRHERYAPEAVEWRGIAEVIVAKNRQGGTGIVPMTFIGSRTAFANFGGALPQRHQPNERGGLS